ncbi:unnamed protein product [Blepharisma stoltei]|uniref:Transposase n=1 Tax=Blepharisma stoltei TaxID=1481888 RepID=A0AAU9JMQ1_9CILI|nr:unnamed protein product [Blepharisma stoltei]
METIQTESKKAPMQIISTSISMRNQLKKFKKHKRNYKIKLEDKMRIINSIILINLPRMQKLEKSLECLHAQWKESLQNIGKGNSIEDGRSDKPLKLSSAASLALTEACLNGDPTISIPERVEKLNKQLVDERVTCKQAYKCMKKLGYTFKKCWEHPINRVSNINLIKRQNVAFRYLEILERNNEIINIDEFHIDNSSRSHGWSKKGQKCISFKKPNYRNYTVILAVSSSNGIIAWRAIEGGNNRHTHLIALLQI